MTSTSDTPQPASVTAVPVGQLKPGDRVVIYGDVPVVVDSVTPIPSYETPWVKMAYRLAVDVDSPTGYVQHGVLGCPASWTVERTANWAANRGHVQPPPPDRPGVALRALLQDLSAGAAEAADKHRQRGDREGTFYARGLRDAYGTAASFVHVEEA